LVAINPFAFHEKLRNLVISSGKGTEQIISAFDFIAFMFGKVYICTGRSKRPRCLTVVVVKCGINSFWKIKNCPSPKKANNDVNSESRTNKNSSRERIWEALRRLLHLSAAGMQFFVFMHRSIIDVATGNRFNIWGESYLLGT